MQVTSTEFAQNVGRYQDEAAHAPVIDTKHNRPYTVLMSASLFEVLSKGRVARSRTWTPIRLRPFPKHPSRRDVPDLTTSSKTGPREPAAPGLRECTSTPHAPR